MSTFCALSRRNSEPNLSGEIPGKFKKTGMDAKAAADFFASAETVGEMRKKFEATGNVACWKSKMRGAGAALCPARQKLSFVQQLHLASHVDTQHAEGRRVTNRKCINWLAEEHNISVSRTTMSRCLR
jgi:hypothetical protein